MSAKRLTLNNLRAFLDALCSVDDFDPDGPKQAWKARAILEFEVDEQRVVPNRCVKRTSLFTYIQEKRKIFEPDKQVKGESHALDTAISDVNRRLQSGRLKHQLYVFSFGKYVFYFTSSSIVNAALRAAEKNIDKNGLRALLYVFLRVEHPKEKSLAEKLLRSADFADRNRVELELKKSFLTSEEIVELLDSLYGARGLNTSLAKGGELFDAYLPENLPAIRHWFGREKELREATSTIADRGTKSLVIVGAAGMGKSSLAIKVIHSLRTNRTHFESIAWESFSGGPDNRTPPSIHTILDGLLDRLATQEEVPRATLGIDKAISKTRRLLRLMKEKRILIVLDNIETILSRSQNDALGRVAPEYKVHDELLRALLNSDNPSKLILTSREIPAVVNRGNSEVMVLSGLARRPASDLLKAMGVQLNREKLTRVLSKAEGRPKFLELIASDPRLLGEECIPHSPAAIYSVDQTDQFLEGILNRLPKSEKSFFLAISVYRTERAPIDVEALTAQLPDYSERQRNQLVIGLQRRRLIDFDTRQQSFSIHPMIKEYTYQLLRCNVSSFKCAQRRAHCHFMCKFSAVEGNWRTTKDLWPLFEAHYHACSAGDWDKASDSLGEFIYDPLYVWSEYRLLVQLLSPLVPEDWNSSGMKVTSVKRHARILRMLALAKNGLEDYEGLEAMLDKSIELCDSIGDKLGMARGLNNKGIYLQETGRPVEAIKPYTRARRLFEDLGENGDLGNVLHNIGNALFDLGKHRKAEEYIKQRLSLAQQVGDRYGEARGCFVLARIHVACERWAAADKSFSTGLNISRRVGDKETQALILRRWGESYITRGKIENGISRLLEAESIYEVRGFLRGSVRVYILLAKAYASLGDSSKALFEAKRAVRTAQEFGLGMEDELKGLPDIYS